MEEGAVCVERLSGKASQVEYDYLPGICYTWPEAASVGKSEEQLKGFNGGNWNKDYSAKVEQSLGAKENDSLNAVANKMLDQQLAAQAEVHPIRITMPIQGRHLAFYRELQIKPQAAMMVSFKAGAGWPLRVGGVVLTLLGLALVFWVAARAAFARRGA